MTGVQSGQMTHQQMSIPDLAAACREETSRYLRRESTCDVCCCELIRRAVCERDDLAWQAVVDQYRGLLLAWLKRHPDWSSVEEQPDDHWVDSIFMRFYTAIGPERFESFGDLAKLLRYLKACAHSALEDEVRAQRAAAPTMPLGDGAPLVSALPNPEAAIVSRLTQRDLWQVIMDAAQHEEERLVARHCLVLHLKPSEVYERHPDRFASVRDVYRVKRNLTDRLRRNPDIRQLLQ